MNKIYPVLFLLICVIILLILNYWQYSSMNEELKNKLLSGFELSGVARVKDGLLVADDELVGSVLFVPFQALDDPDRRFVNVRIVKISAEEKNSFNSRLLPLQDVEGIASDDQSTVYLLGSHNTKEKKDHIKRRSNREFIIKATYVPDESDPELTNAQIYRNLIPDLTQVMASLNINWAATDETLATDINLEGLAYNEGILYIGFRTPLTKDRKAIILSIKASELFNEKATKNFNIFKVDSGGLGVRSLEWNKDLNRLIIIAGTTGDDNDRTLLLSFDPETEELQTINTDLSPGKKPEGLTFFVYNGQKYYLVVNDESGDIEFYLVE